ncbi:MAG: single-stranded-DNA-specific exonuclease RecJ [Candidatus Omnitrophica bacterium]|nr:single-stranded-DNA-specific exonuclease RecJ [Candidatus Omnitrophota bacterium]
MLWKTFEPNPRLQKILSDALGITPYLAQLLINRDIKTVEKAQEFLFGDASAVHDPFLMKDMAAAVERINNAIEKREKILIYGDYDVDGITSTALLADILKFLGARVETFIPNRLEEGYGLNMDAILGAKEKQIDLLVTVDCGINSVKEVECAKNFGMDVIITDHHVVRSDSRPKASAIIDPHQPDCNYPFKELAGVGVAYKLALAVAKGNEKEVNEHLDLVALGTVADIVPLIGENRILTKMGLKKLRSTRKEGLKALMDVASLSPEKINCRHIGFAMGPRINAMGRVGSADVALDLLMSKDNFMAGELARTVDRENRNRQNIEKDILKQALEKVTKEVDLEKEKIIVLADEAWHSGIIGIVASRLTEEYSKPAILISLDGENGKGSGRGVEGFNLFEAIKKSSEHLIDFGGHKLACGLKIKKENIELFKTALNKIAGECSDGVGAEAVELKIDLQIPFSYISAKLINELELLMPFGAGNKEPIFLTKGVRVKNPPRDIARSGFKFLATCGNLTCEAVTFKKSEIDKPAAGDILDLAYTPSINDWRGIETIQLNIKGIQVVGKACRELV